MTTHSDLRIVRAKTTKGPAPKSFGPGCQDLHGWYINMANATRQNKEDCTIGSHKCEPFLSPDYVFIVQPRQTRHWFVIYNELILNFHTNM
uniref:Uncharacterized protein n=1 Tax=Leersia perrieri TaxID=77586 RepID=A0A0D9W253_9ORYZ